MAQISQTEISRQYRVLRQTLEMHTMLRDGFYFKAKAAEIILIICSVVFCATTFSKDNLFTTFGLEPETARIVLGIASILAFSSSLVVLVLNWRGKAAEHESAVKRWSIALRLFREHKQEGGAWPIEMLSQLSSGYWEADRNTVPIQSGIFNSLKTRYLRKKAISKLKEKYAFCPNIILRIAISINDSYRAFIDEEPHKDN